VLDCLSVLAIALSRSPTEATKKPLCRAFLWAVLGSSQRPPACRLGAAVRVSSRAFAQAAWLSGIHPATERLSERERTLILAILATRPQPSRLVLSSKYPFDSAAAIPAAHTRKAVATQEPTSSRHTNKPSEGWNIRTRRLSDRKPVCVTSSRARSLHNQRSQRSTHEHPLDHPDRRPCARPAWLFRSRPLLGIGLRHA
jgi:hypothetical protein